MSKRIEDYFHKKSLDASTSGGSRKRVCLGLPMTDPSVVVMSEVVSPADVPLAATGVYDSTTNP
jgi:ABC-type glutathione transport system ATPase component